MKSPTKHGGKRQGAGRKRKWSFSHVLKIGQECEALFRIELAKTFEREKDRSFNLDSDLKSYWEAIARVPIEKRSDYIKNERFEEHQFDIETELRLLAGKLQSEAPVQRVVQIRCRPRRGARKKIIETVAHRNNLTTNQVDNLWQAYRRFEKTS